MSGYSGVAGAATQPVPDTAPPTAPTGLSASAGSASQIDLAWTPSTDNVGVAGYQIDRCQGAGCTAFTQIATSSAAGFSDTGLAASTTYRYQVRATDAAGNVSANSSIVTATTQAAPDTTPPSAPAGLGAAAASATQIDLSWAASSDNVGVAGYRVERCQGAGCGSFAQIATPAGTTFSDSGLTLSTSYSYRVRAVDAAGNLSPYSNVASATTQGGQLYYIVPDHLNTPRLIANQQGATVWKWDQAEPFGASAPNADADGDGVGFDFPLRFPGQYFDRDTNLSYNYFRDYISEVGRYAQSDPIGLRTGVNTYVYVDDAPINNTDPLGLFSGAHHENMTRIAAYRLCPRLANALPRMVSDVDWEAGSQDPWNAPRHSDSNGPAQQSSAQAASERDSYIESQLSACTAKGLANALHAGQDKYSRSHNQPWFGGRPSSGHIIADTFGAAGGPFGKAEAESETIILRFKGMCPCMCN